MLEFGLIGLSLLMTIIIIVGYRSALYKTIADKTIRNRRMGILIGFFIFWGIYLYILSSQQILFELSLPPRVPLLIFVPLIVVTTIFYFRNRNDEVLHNIPKTYPIYYQSFRIMVETLLLYTFYAGILTQKATFEGWNFDVIMGISAPFVAYFIYPKLDKYHSLAKAWNILGIFMVLFVAFIVATSFYLPSFWNSDTPTMSTQFVELPYLLVAGFLAPSAIFIHVVALMQLKK
ncbi:MAG: hypothetical protein AB8G11_18830 [Saprospiraceae bacterium]